MRRTTNETHTSRPVKHQSRVMLTDAGVPIRVRPVFLMPFQLNSGEQTLSRIIFPQCIEEGGLSLATMLALPRQELVGCIPDYYGLSPDDQITLTVRRRGGTKAIRLGELSPGVCDRPLTVRYNRAALESIGRNGRVQFMYEVRDARGQKVGTSAPTPLNLLIKGAPETLPGPMLVGASYGVVSGAALASGLAVDIPATVPGCKAGDLVRLRAGDMWFGAVALDKHEAAASPMLRLVVPRSDLQYMSRRSGAERFDIDIAYDVDRGGLVSSSAVASATIDLTPAPLSRSGGLRRVGS